MKLTEDIDYYIEHGNYVFTEEHHKKRAYCCNNDCRHCPFKSTFAPKVISLVPSWTETLLACDINVVARTRFCIHPQDKVEAIPVIGGTKEIQLEKLTDINYDYILIDKEENPKKFTQDMNGPFIITHTESIASMLKDMKNINYHLCNKKLGELIVAAEKLPALKRCNIKSIPGIKEWIIKPKQEIKMIIYLIWKDPWMTISKKTFIASIFNYFQIDELLPDFDTKYPQINLEDYPLETTLLLFSSEPYPFEKKKEKLKEMGYPCAIIDGEMYSWFGARTINFLKDTN